MNLPEIFDEDELDEINLILYGIPRRIYERKDYFHSFDDWTFFKRFRVTKDTAVIILNMIEDPIEYPYDLNNSVAPINQLLIFLRFCATGSHIAHVADFIGVHESTVSRLVVRVSKVLASFCQKFIQMPSTPDEISESQLSFYQLTRFPRVVGTLDGTHVKILLPGPTTRAEELYNKSHIRTRNSVERMIGVWKRRFPVLAYGCRLKPDTILMVIVATGVLYNICKKYNEEEPPAVNDIEQFLNVMVEDDVPKLPVYNV